MEQGSPPKALAALLPVQRSLEVRMPLGGKKSRMSYGQWGGLGGGRNRESWFTPVVLVKGPGLVLI